MSATHRLLNDLESTLNISSSQSKEGDAEIDRLNVLLLNLRRMLSLCDSPLNLNFKEDSYSTNEQRSLMQKEVITLQDDMIEDISVGLTNLHEKVRFSSFEILSLYGSKFSKLLLLFFFLTLRHLK